MDHPKSAKLVSKPVTQSYGLPCICEGLNLVSDMHIQTSRNSLMKAEENQK